MTRLAPPPDRPTRAAFASVAAIAIAVLVAGATVMEQWMLASVPLLAAPVIVFFVTRTAGPRAGVVFGVALACGTIGAAVLSHQELSLGVGDAVRTARPRMLEFDRMFGGAVVAASTFSGGLAGALLIRDRGQSSDRWIRAVVGAATAVALSLATAGVVASAGSPTRAAWLASLTEEAWPMGVGGRQTFVDFGSDRQWLPDECGSQLTTEPSRAGTIIAVKRDVARDLTVVFCTTPFQLMRETLVAAYRAGPATPAALKRGEMRFAAPRATKRTAVSGVVIAALWIAWAVRWRTRALRAKSTTVASDLDYRAPAGSGPATITPPPPNDPWTRAIEGHFTAICACAAGLTMFVSAPLAFAR